ncbi:MAG TPA: polysaccharide deacetylase family protein [Candidatus Dormibacteraeota bacterium]|nr:polysaccharide deacetylase family protein [Candidatus Dormibacteraeota bacterium]
MSPSSQVFGRFPWRVSTDKKVVALTFDDGPNEPYTSQIADFLADKKIKATFFQVGTCIERYPSVTKRLYDDGHDIGNHSLHHRFSDYLKHPVYSREIAKNQEIIFNRIGKRPALFRSPWLVRQPWLLRSLRSQSLQPVSGRFCHSLEVFQPGGERIARAALKKVRPGAIIIFHDGFDGKTGDRSQTVKAVKTTVNSLIKQGYKCVTVSELLGVPAYQN